MSRFERCWDVLLTNYAVSGTKKFPEGALAAPDGPPGMAGAHRGGRRHWEDKLEKGLRLVCATKVHARAYRSRTPKFSGIPMMPEPLWCAPGTGNDLPRPGGAHGMLRIAA